MKLYFSGVASAQEAAWLRAAGVSHVLVNHFDFHHLGGEGAPPFPHVALDSPAYYVHKRRLSYDVDTYAAVLESDTYTDAFDFRVSLDVIGDGEASYRNWRALKRRGLDVMPVWHMDTDGKYLARYMDSDAPVIGLGGYVSALRAKDEKVLGELIDLVDGNEGRFHLFGCNWLKAITELRLGLASADTSKWLDGGRYGHVIFRHTRTGYLQQAHARKHLGLLMSRDERNLQNARSMEIYCNGRREVRL